MNFTRRDLHITAVAAVFLSAASLVRAEDAKDAPKKVTYADHVQPIFRQKCFGCHNTDKKSGGLDLTNFTNLSQGGSSGTVIEAGSAEDSYLWMLVNHESEPKMPPESEKLPDEMLAVIRAWLDGGALETASSKAMAAKPKVDLSLAGPSTERPAGPPPLPERLPLEPVVHTERPGAVVALATSPWAPLVAVAGQQQVLLYHAESLQLVGILPFPEGVPHVLKFSRNGSLLLAGGGRGAYQGKVVVFDIKTGERVIEVGDEVDAVLAADISADHNYIALGGPNRIVRVYSTKTGEVLHTITKHTEWIYAVAFSPDGVLLATADRNGGLLVWEAHTAREYLTLGGHQQAITDLSWRPDSNVLAAASQDTNVSLWEMENGNRVKQWGAHGGGVQSVEFTRDGRLVSAGRDNTAKLWDQNGQQLRAFEAFGDLALAVTHCDETNRVIAGDYTGALRVWKSDDGARLGELALNPPMLEERLKAAEVALAAAQAEHKKLADATTAAQAALDKAKADLAAAQTAAADLQKQSETLTQTVASGKQSVETLTAEVAAVTKSVQTLEPVIAPLTESVAKGQAALEKVPDDKELAAAVAGVKAQLDKKSADLAGMKKTLTDKSAALEKSKVDLAAAEKQLADTAAGLKAAQERVATLTPTVPAAEAAYNQAKQQSDAAAAQATAAQQEVDRWKGEITFRDKTKELSAALEQHAELAAATDTAKQELDKRQSELTAAQEAATAAQKQVESATAAVQTAQQALTTATADRDATAKSIADLEAALPILKDAAEKAQAAAAKVPGDTEVATAATQLKTLFDTKTQALAATKKSLEEKTALVEKSKTAVAESEKQLTAQSESLKAAQTRVEQATAAVTPAQPAFDAAKQQSDAANARVEALRQEVDALKGKAAPKDAVAQAPAPSPAG